MDEVAWSGVFVAGGVLATNEVEGVEDYNGKNRSLQVR